MNDLLSQKVMESIVPIISDVIVYNKFDDNCYLIQNQENKFNIKVSIITYQLLQLIDGRRSIKEITDIMNEKGDFLFTPKNIYNVLHQQLSIYGIVKGFPEDVEVKERVIGIEYLSVRVTLLSRGKLLFFTRILSPIFNPIFFYWLALGGIFWICLIIIYFKPEQSLLKSIEPSNLLYFYILYVLGCIIHELGHASACHYFGAKHGGIGFGFYLFSPVFYADVSDAWKLSASQRVIIDLGGVFMQIIYISLLSIIFLITNHFFWMNVMIFISISIIPNINPFLRLDGYWTLSDYMNIPNLRKHSNDILLKTVKWVYGKNSFPIKDTRTFFLMFYALISNVFIVIFLASILLYNPKSIIYFPKDFYNFLLTAWKSLPNFYFIYELMKQKSTYFFIPFLFYFIVLKMLFQKGKDYIKYFLTKNY